MTAILSGDTGVDTVGPNTVGNSQLIDGSVQPAKLAQKLTLMTAQNTTSGTFIDFTGIPSWVKRITVMFNGVSLSGTSNFLIQLGSGSLQTTGYNSSSGSISNSVVNATAGSTSSAGVVMYSAVAAAVWGGSIELTLCASNSWSAKGVIGTFTASSGTNMCGGNVTLSGTLDRIRLTTVNGTDVFDAGSVNVMYEG